VLREILDKCSLIMAGYDALVVLGCQQYAPHQACFVTCCNDMLQIMARENPVPNTWSSALCLRFKLVKASLQN
jgi:hypothetical protein